MTRFTLRDDGFPTYKKIMSGGKWIGRVCKKADGSYLGIIDKSEARARSERSAFDNVVAKHCGFNDIDDMQQHNSLVRQRNRQRRAVARHAADELLKGNFSTLDALFGKSK